MVVVVVMGTKTIHIKNMVCPRCIMTVESILEKLGFTIKDVQLGAAIVIDNKDDLQELEYELKKVGFELIKNKNQQIVEKIKNLIVQHIHYSKGKPIKYNFSKIISQELNKDYHYLSNLFSQMEKTTIEKYIIRQKVERIKELLEYDELNLNEIALKMNYSSSAHLSSQFKSLTGISPSKYKQQNLRRKDLTSL